MIESYLREPFQLKIINPLVNFLALLGLKPNHLTLLAAFLGILVAPALYFKYIWLSVILIILSGLLDICDGTLARKINHVSDFGCILDIFCDRLVELAILLGLFLYQPDSRGLILLFLLGAFYLCVTSFLLSGIFTPNKSHKSFEYSPGLIERSETFIYFLLVILFDQIFFWTTIIFALLVYLTAIIRIYEMANNFLNTKKQSIPHH